MQALVEAKIARPLPDPEVGLVLYRAINLAHIVFGPLIEQMLNLSLSDPVVLARFRDAAVDLLTRREKVILDRARAPGFTSRDMREALSESREIH